MARLMLEPLAMAAPGVIERPILERDDLPAAGHGWIVIVYDNDTNTYDEVIEILMVATKCALQEAEIEAWEIDHLGKSVVHHGIEEECRTAGEIISKIGIKVEVSRE